MTKGVRRLLEALLLGCLLSIGGCDDTKNDGGWTDPFEMGSSPQPESQPTLKAPLKVKSLHTSESDLRLIRIVKSFLRALDSAKRSEGANEFYWELEMKLANSELSLLKSYSEDLSSSVSLRDVEDALHSAFDSAKPVVETSTQHQLPSLPFYNAEDLMIIFIVGLIFCLALAFFTGMVSWVKLLFGFTVLCSVWKWMQLRMSKQLDKDTACINSNNGWFRSWGDSCSKSMKDQLMDAKYEVSPMHALVDTLTEMFVRPLPIFGENLGKFFDSFWGNNGFFSTMFGYGFLLITMILIIPTCIFAFYYFGMPARRQSPRKKSRSSDDKIKVLESQVQALTSTISTLREVSLQSMEYNINRRVEEMKNSRDAPRSTVLPVKHVVAPSLEDNPPLKKLKSVAHPGYDDNDDVYESSSTSDEGKKAVTSLSSDLILSPPSNFKNLTDKEEEIDGSVADGKEDSGNKELVEEKEVDGEEEEVDGEEEEDDDFEVISKSTPPPEQDGE